jgi:hypothetical protein
MQKSMTVVKAAGATTIFAKTESGARTDRKQLAKAIAEQTGRVGLLNFVRYF